jgi:hypothetical protein
MLIVECSNQCMRGLKESMEEEFNGAKRAIIQRKKSDWRKRLASVRSIIDDRINDAL